MLEISTIHSALSTWADGVECVTASQSSNSSDRRLKSLASHGLSKRIDGEAAPLPKFRLVASNTYIRDSG